MALRPESQGRPLADAPRRSVHTVSPSGHRFWTSREVGRVAGTPIERTGLLNVGDRGQLGDGFEVVFAGFRRHNRFAAHS